MAIPRKGSREIVVDGDRFRWLVTHRGTDVQIRHGRVCAHVAVEPLGRKRRGTLWIVDERCFPAGVEVPVLPSNVASWIRRAVDSGWHPHTQGSTFKLVISD